MKRLSTLAAIAVMTVSAVPSFAQAPKKPVVSAPNGIGEKPCNYIRVLCPWY